MTQEKAAGTSRKDFENVYQIYTSCKTTRDQVSPLWNDISKFVGIGVDPDYAHRGANANKARQLDDYVDDPTSAISVNQAGDYLAGIAWGTGEGVFDIVPSRHVLELVDKEVVEDYYKYATEQALYHMNHHEAGYTTSLRTYMYDQVGFGTSGVGIFVNSGFTDGVDDNALTCRQYGVDNVVIDVGKSGLVDYVFATYNWRVSRIVGEFCMVDGIVSEEKLKMLPKAIREAYTKGNLNDKHDVVFGMMPRTDYNPRLKGKRGTRYRGVWFMADEKMKHDAFFLEESFAEKPINIARMIVVRGEVWGRSSGTMLLSSIRSVNYMVGTAIEIIEKMADPALGIYSNAIFGDDVLDTSPSGLTVFNSTLAGATGGNPAFPLYDVGNPSALVEFLIPYLNEKITTAFKVDALLDFNSNRDMTATETLKRAVIRGQSLSGILIQQKNERLIPDARRAISLLLNVGELGVDPTANGERAKLLRRLGRLERIIPEAVLEVMKTGKTWYELRWNNELEKIIRTEKVQNLLQILQAILAIMGAYPDIVHAVDWYKLLKDINDNLDANNEVLLTPTQFKEKIIEIGKQRAQAQAAAMGQQLNETAKTGAEATKLQKETRNA